MRARSARVCGRVWCYRGFGILSWRSWEGGVSPQHSPQARCILTKRMEATDHAYRPDHIGVVPDIDEAGLPRCDLAKEGCPVSQALSGVKRMLEAKLERG